MAEPYLIVGLGNPGTKYANTRHNIGFRCVDELAQKYGLALDKKQARGHVASGLINGHKVLLAKPQTFMNASGETVRSLVDFYKIPLERLMVIFDDLDLPLGTLRIRKSGGTGGHNGMKSITQHLGGQNFARVRFGIGRPPGRMDPAAYVLRPFDDAEDILVIETVERVCRALVMWLDEGIERAMSQHNGTAEQAANASRSADAQHAAETQRPAAPTATTINAENSEQSE